MSFRATRPIRKTDFRRIIDIEKITLEEYVQYLEKSGEKDIVTPSLTPSRFRHYLKQRSSFVAEVENVVVGYLLCQPTSFVHGRRKELWLDYIAVLPEFRRKGVGSSLLSKAVLWARAHHFESLYTDLNPNNPESAGLLRKEGFETRNWMKAEKILRKTNPSDVRKDAHEPTPSISR